MSAKEMFEKLGFKYKITENYILCKIEKECKYIWFYKFSKKINVYFDYDMKVLQAINKQICELGWNNEN